MRFRVLFVAIALAMCLSASLCVSGSSTAEELANTKDRKSVYQKAIALTPGTYKVDVAVHTG